MTANKNITSARFMKDSEIFTVTEGKKYLPFTKDAKQIARKMSQQYAAKKKAFETANSSFAKTGSLDISRISSFKTSDSIFKTKMMKKEGQSHGLILVIDWSGSMSGTIKYVACQVLITMLYAKYSGIPFEVYTFTSGSSGYGKSDKTLKTYGRNFSFYRIADTSFKEKDLINLFGHMIAYDEKHNIKMSDYYNQYVREKLGNMGGTPLVQAQIASYIAAYDLREKFKLQNVSIMFLTDGEGDNPYYNNDSIIDPISKREYFYKTKNHSNNTVLSAVNKMIREGGFKIFNILLTKDNSVASTTSSYFREYHDAKLTSSQVKSISYEVDERYSKNGYADLKNFMFYDNYIFMNTKLFPLEVTSADSTDATTIISSRMKNIKNISLVGTIINDILVQDFKIKK